MTALLLLASVTGAAAEKAQYLDAAPLTFETATGRHDFVIEIAASPAQRRKGLMFRPRLADNGGMLFWYRTPLPLGMWMKNTPNALDMVFVDAKGLVINIAADVEPFSYDTVVSAAPAVMVIELRGGRAAEIGLKPGDRVRHALLKNLPRP